MQKVFVLLMSYGDINTGKRTIKEITGRQYLNSIQTLVVKVYKSSRGHKEPESIQC